MRIRTQISVSVDGFMALPNGAPTMNAIDFEPAVSHGTAELLAECEAVLVGRNVFEAGYGWWAQSGQWAWQGKKVFVISSRPLPERLPEHVYAAGADAVSAVICLREAGLQGDVHLVGGLQTLQSVFALGAIDQLGFVVLPVLLGAGISLFPLSGELQWLKPVKYRAFDDGCYLIVYERGERPGSLHK